MRKNRKIPKKMTIVAANSLSLGSIIICFLVMVIMNHLSASSCNRLVKAKGDMERELVKLSEDCQREQTHWNSMKTYDKLDDALYRHGLSMKPPRADQNIRMRKDGRPYPGQLGLHIAKQNQFGGAQSARYTRNKVR